MSAEAPSEADRIAARDQAARLHEPVLLSEVVEALDPGRGGAFLDGTFGAGGYARALLEAGAEQVIGLDRDPEAIARGAVWAPLYGGRLTLVEARFSELDAQAPEGGLAGVALDLGVSSMQLDQGARGFSFMRDGPLDMRMGEGAVSAADLVAGLGEGDLADLLYAYGEERASRRIARAIVAARQEAPIDSTARLAAIVERVQPRPKPGQPHPATRSFQALRIAVNGEFEQLVEGLAAAERALAPGGVLAVVSFHSLEDRIAKRFFQDRASQGGGGSRYEPDINRPPATFEPLTKGAVGPGAAELERNPRARTAKLRAARRTDATARAVDAKALGAPAWSARGFRSAAPGAGDGRGKRRTRPAKGGAR